MSPTGTRADNRPNPNLNPSYLSVRTFLITARTLVAPTRQIYSAQLEVRAFLTHAVNSLDNVTQHLSAPEHQSSWGGGGRLCRPKIPEIPTHIVPLSQITSDLCQAAAAQKHGGAWKSNVTDLAGSSSHHLVRAHTQEGRLRGRAWYTFRSTFARFPHHWYLLLYMYRKFLAAVSS